MATLITASLASGCTVLVPIIANGAQSTPRKDDTKAQRTHDNTIVGAAAVGILFDTLALVTVAIYVSGLDSGVE